MNQDIFKVIHKVTHSGGSGSCFYLRKHNLFVTNYHVVEGFQEVAVHDRDRNPYLAKVVLVNPTLDIALLKVDADFAHLPEIELARDESLSIGHKVFVAGYPYGMPFTVTEGTVSSPKQLMKGRNYIQTDAAVNPGNSGGPIFNEAGEVVGVTVSKFTDADNMGFGIRVEDLRHLLSTIDNLDREGFHVQCYSCDMHIQDKTEYCPSCGEKLATDVFAVRQLSPLGEFCEEAISALGINPVIARDGFEDWTFHKGSSEIRLFAYDNNFLFCVSILNLLPKTNVEPVLHYLLEQDFHPYKFGLDGREIIMVYRTHLTDITDASRERIKQYIIAMAEKADELDNFFVETFGCEYSEYSKVDNDKSHID